MTNLYMEIYMETKIQITFSFVYERPCHISGWFQMRTPPLKYNQCVIIKIPKRRYGLQKDLTFTFK